MCGLKIERCLFYSNTLLPVWWACPNRNIMICLPLYSPSQPHRWVHRTLSQWLSRSSQLQPHSTQLSLDTHPFSLSLLGTVWADCYFTCKWRSWSTQRHQTLHVIDKYTHSYVTWHTLWKWLVATRCSPGPSPPACENCRRELHVTVNTRCLVAVCSAFSALVLRRDSGLWLFKCMMGCRRGN